MTTLERCGQLLVPGGNKFKGRMYHEVLGDLKYVDWIKARRRSPNTQPWMVDLANYFIAVKMVRRTQGSAGQTPNPRPAQPTSGSSATRHGTR